MKRTPILVVVLPLALSSVAVAVSAPTYAATTCHGLPVTIQGTPGATAQGTPGNDVIDTNGASTVAAGAGDDTVCVTNSGELTVLTTDDGNDYVDATQGNKIAATLGTGSDTYRGGAATDWVTAGTGLAGVPEVGGAVDVDADDIETGAGADLVSSGHDGMPNGDRLVLGDGDDQLYLHGTTAAADSGTGADQLVPSTDPDDPALFGLDSRAGVLTREGVAVWSIPGFTDFVLRRFALAGPATIRGSGADEEFNLFERPSGGRVDIAAGGGDDNVNIAEGQVGTLAGQGGRDELRVVSPIAGSKKARGQLELRLDRQRATVTTAGRTRHWKISSFESVTALGFYRAHAVGTDKSELIRLGSACHVTIEGRGGDDTLVRRHSFSCGPGKSGGGDQSDVLRGGPGNDILIGSSGPDVLLGDSGRDRADGRLGDDRCVAEIRKGCETS